MKTWLWLVSWSLTIGLSVVSGAGLALAFQTLPVAASAPSASEETVARGLEVYHAQYCGMCHELRSAGTTGTFGPPHDAVGVIAGARLQDPNYHGAATSAEAYIRESIIAPKTYLVPGYGLTYHHMPAYTSLSEDDLNALVTMLLAQTGVQR